MKLGHLELFVTDPLRSMAFYHDVLGFDVTVIQGDQFVWLQSGQQELLLRAGLQTGAAPSYGRSRIALVLYTDDLAASLQKLHEHGLTPQVMAESDACYTFTDPDGHWLQLVNPATQ